MPRARYRSEVNPRIKTLPQMMKLDKGDMKSMTKAVDVLFAKNERRLFASEGASGGEKWPPRKRKRPQKIMQRTGRLRKSLSQRRHPDHISRSRLRPRASITVGTRVKYAARHISGLLKNPSLPERDTLQHTEAQAQGYRGKVSDYMTNVKLERVRKVLAAWRGRRRGVA